MKNSPWIIATVAAAGAAVVYILLNQPGPEYATGSDTIEGAARNTARWGSKNRLSGVGSNLLGKVKETVGRITANPDLADEGATDQIAGSFQNAAGQVAEAAGQTLHDLNR
jgi:uncharacterized protein YjbJ (UPF0337 family)